MELLLPCVLFLTIFSVCFRDTDGNNVTLTPSPIATVTEGEDLVLQCNYSGSFSLITVNWYLNGEISGLALLVSDCSYQSIPSVYETGRYVKTCSTPSFSLLIKNVTKDKDDGDIWACDTTPIGSTLPTKVSTVITVLEQTTVPTTSPATNGTSQGTTTTETVTSTTETLTSTTETLTSTTETLTSTSSPPTSTSSTKLTTNSTSVNPASTGSTANATFSISTPTGSTANATFSTSTPTGSTANATFSTSTPSGSTAYATFSTSTPTGSTANAIINTSIPTNYATRGSTSTSSAKSNSSQGGDDTTVIVLAVVVPIGGLLLIGVIIFVLCIRHHRPGKNDHEIPYGKAAQNRSNIVDGFRHDRTAKQSNAIQTTPDDFIIYPGPAAMSTARPNKNKKHHIVPDQYQTLYTGFYGYQNAYDPSTYMSDRSSTHKDTKHHNVGHPYSRPYTGTYGYQNAYDPSTYMSARTYPSKNKSYDYESPYRIADNRSAYDQAAYYPHTGYYGKIRQDVYYRGGGQYSYGQRSRSHHDQSGRKQQREYYNQYEMADYGDNRTRYGQTEQYGQNTAFYY